MFGAFLAAAHLWGRAAPLNLWWAALAGVRFFRAGPALSAHHLLAPSQETQLIWPPLLLERGPRAHPEAALVVTFLALSSRPHNSLRYQRPPALFLLPAAALSALISPPFFGALCLACLYASRWPAPLTALHVSAL